MEELEINTETAGEPEATAAAQPDSAAAQSDSAAPAEPADTTAREATPEDSALSEETALAEEAVANQSQAAPEDSGENPAAQDPDAAEVAAVPLPLPLEEAAPAPAPVSDAQLQAVLEAVVYVAEEPLTLAQIAIALSEPVERVESTLRRLMEEFERAEHGIGIREVAGGFKMATKAEHHEAVRSFVKSLKPPLKLSLPALETLAVIAYKQPVTAPEIMEIRGVQGAGVLKTLLDRKLIAGAGRKNVIGKPILYKTTKEFLIQFGLKDIAELPSLKEFEEIRRMAFADAETAPATEAQSATAAAPPPATAAAPQPSPEAEPQPTTEAAPQATPAAESQGSPADESQAAPPAEPEPES